LDGVGQVGQVGLLDGVGQVGQVGLWTGLDWLDRLDFGRVGPGWMRLDRLDYVGQTLDELDGVGLGWTGPDRLDRLDRLDFGLGRTGWTKVGLVVRPVKSNFNRRTGQVSIVHCAIPQMAPSHRTQHA
jgi:hypothetical protein